MAFREVLMRAEPATQNSHHEGHEGHEEVLDSACALRGETTCFILALLAGKALKCGIAGKGEETANRANNANNAHES